MKTCIICLFLLISALNGGKKWFQGNLKGIDDVTFELDINGIEDGVWEKRISSFIRLRLLEHEIRFTRNQMPKMVLNINVVDSRIEKVSSFLTVLSIYNFSINERDYYESMADTIITSNLMISKVFSAEILGQTSSDKLYRDIEKNINKLLSSYIDYWYRDNPTKQF